MPLISVIVPVYKVEPFIRRCIDSILSQTFTDFELILVDDGSPDNCPAICDEYASKDNRILAIHQNNSGLSSARNTGLDYAFYSSDSKWVTFIDSDDWVDEHYLEYLYKAVKSNNTLISSCAYMIVNEDQQNQKNNLEKYQCTLYAPEEYFEKNRINAIVAWGKLYKKCLFESVRYPVGRINEDLFTTHKLLFICEMVSIVECKLYMYFIRSESISRSTWERKRFDEIDASEKLISFMENNGFLKGRTTAIKHYINVLHYQFNQIAPDKDVFQAERKIIQQKLKRALLKYRKEVPFAENQWHYEAVYPNLMSIYWIAKNKLNKTSR